MLFFKSAELLDTTAQGCGGELRKANTVFFALSFSVQDEGFWKLLGREANASRRIKALDIFLCDRRNGCRVGIKDSDNITNTDILIVTYVKIHNFFTYEKGLLSL